VVEITQASVKHFGVLLALPIAAGRNRVQKSLGGSTVMPITSPDTSSTISILPPTSS
jgi:ABC-type spermidine/putrescine transport system permease subunit II